MFEDEVVEFLHEDLAVRVAGADPRTFYPSPSAGDKVAGAGVREALIIVVMSGKNSHNVVFGTEGG